MKQLIIGSRESRLAIIQAELVRGRLQSLHPGLRVGLRTYKTTGDKILDRTLDKVGGKGLFTRELEAALLRGETDLLVHSFKDVPMQVDARIPIVGVSPREDARDALILPEGAAEPDLSLPIGCSSLRRTLQLQTLYPGARILPVRGNVLTRLRKLDGGEYGALCLAAAGLKRLGLEGRIARYFTAGQMLPAACQGILALQARADFDRSLLDGLHDEAAWAEALCERSFVRELDGGCSSPVAAHAVLSGYTLRLTGLYVEADGVTMHVRSASGPRGEAEALGSGLASQMRERWSCG